MAGVYDDRGTYLGSINSSGEMYNDKGDYLGSIGTDGRIYDYHGNYMGSIWSNGYIYLDGSYAGLIDESGYVYRNSTYVGHIEGYHGSGASTAKSSPTEQPSPTRLSSSVGTGSPTINRPSVSDLPGTDSGLGCAIWVALILCGIVFVIAVILTAVIVAAIVAGIAAITYGLSFLVKYGIDKATEGKFSQNPHAKVISILISAGILVGTFGILYSTGVLDYFMESSSENLKYSDNSETVSSKDVNYILGYGDGRWRDIDTGAWIHYDSEKESIEFGYDETDNQSFSVIDMLEIVNEEDAMSSGFSNDELENWNIENYNYYQLNLSNNNGNDKKIHMFQSIYIERGSFDWYDPQIQQTYSFGLDVSEDDYNTSQTKLESVLDFSTYDVYDIQNESGIDMSGCEDFYFSYPADFLQIIDKELPGDGIWMKLEDNDNLASVEARCFYQGDGDPQSNFQSAVSYIESSMVEDERILYTENASDGFSRAIVTGYTKDKSQIVYAIIAVDDLSEKEIIIYTDNDEQYSSYFEYMTECMYQECGFSNASKSERSSQSTATGGRETDSKDVSLSSETRVNADLYPQPERELEYFSSSPMTGDDIKYVQAALSEMNYSGITVNGVYDSATESAVRRFQKNHQYTQTGIVDEDMAKEIADALDVWRNKSQESVKLTSETTANADLYPIPERSLRYISSSPMTGDDIKYVQAALIEMNYTDTAIYVSGTYDSYTEEAVKRFQTNHGLYVDGIVGTKTIAELQSSLSAWRKKH